VLSLSSTTITTIGSCNWSAPDPTAAQPDRRL
jgi:hypothetical protein